MIIEQYMKKNIDRMEMNMKQKDEHFYLLVKLSQDFHPNFGYPH